MNKIKNQLINLIQNYKLDNPSDLVSLQTDIVIDISNVLRAKLNNVPSLEDFESTKVTLELKIDNSFDPTPFDQESMKIEFNKDTIQNEKIIALCYEDNTYVILSNNYTKAIDYLVDVPLTMQTLNNVSYLYNLIKDSDKGYEKEVLESINNLLGCNGLDNNKFILELSEYNTLIKKLDNTVIGKVEIVENNLVHNEDKDIVTFNGVDINKPLDKKLNLDESSYIYICETRSGKFAITAYQYAHKECYYIILDKIGIEEWVEQHKENLNKFPELRDKLVLDQLTYDEFLTLEGWVDTLEVEALAEQDNLDENGIHSDEIANFMAEEKKPVFNLTEHQQSRFEGLISKIDDILALQRSLTRPPVPAYYMATLEGAAGTGKTTMMKKVIEELLNKGLSIVFCSPTHQALGVIRETLRETDLDFTEVNEDFIMGDYNLILKTLASFLGIKMQRDLENGTESFVPDPKAPQISCDVLCIDESSMVSKDQLRIIIQKLHIHVKCILFIGDEVQLDSPADNNESNGIFNLPQKYSLEEPVRQAADNKILQFAWELRNFIKSKQCNIPPSLLLHPGRINENILIFNDQQSFLNHYFQNESENKLVATYTNKITNEYNSYIRQMKLIGQGGKPLDIIINGDDPDRHVIVDWNEFKEYYIGEELVSTEPNQRNGDVIHQTGERFKIKMITEREHSIGCYVTDDTDMMAEPIFKEYILRYYELVDTNFKTINVIKFEDTALYNEILVNLSLEAKKSVGKKHPWSKYWSFKEKFTKVNKTFAFTLHKLQGSTCENIYIDARDLDKFFKSMAIGVYKLIYIALTRPKQTVIFLI